MASLPIAAPMHSNTTIKDGDVSDAGLTAVAVMAETQWGEEVRVVGDIPELGAWSPERGVRLQVVSDQGPGKANFWGTVVRLPEAALASSGGDGGRVVEYKFVVTREGGTARWEDGPNRRLDLAAPGFVLACFGMPLEALASAMSPNPARSLAEPGRLVIWEISCPQARWGDALCVVGSLPGLGSWEPSSGVALRTSKDAFPLWRGGARLPQSWPHGAAWKLVLRRAGGRAEWEGGGDRDLAPAAEELVTGICILRSHFDRRQGTQPGNCELSIRRMPSTISTCSTSLTPEEGCLSRSTSVGVLDGPGWDCDSPCEDAELRMWAGAHCIGKSIDSCEDAHFFGPSAVGVADGVGSMRLWASDGVDSAAYAAELMETASRVLRSPRGPPGQAAAPGAESSSARALAAVEAAEREARSYGAATVTVLEMDGGRIGVANLGDSGFMVLRRGEQGRLEVAARSSEQQHHFNFPYQLARLPEKLLAKLKPGNRPDTARDCERYELSVRAGDLVLVFTDGFSDNLCEQEALAAVEDLLTHEAHSSSPKGPGAWRALPGPDLVAQRLAGAAQERSVDRTASVPFHDAARQYGYRCPLGGKEDDITVVAAWIMPRASPSYTTCALAGA